MLPITMLTLQGKKPFSNRSFYLDLKYYNNQDALVKDLKKLGGKVESFLSKDITDVITNKTNLKTKFDWAPLTPKSYVSSPSPRYIPESVLNHFDTPTHTSSSPHESRNQIMSRGLALVQKAKQKNQGTTDVLEVCSQWNIKVVHLQRILSWISKYKQIHVKKVESQGRSKKILAKTKKGNCQEKLISPFIKVENVNCKYKPLHKVFKSWDTSVDTNLYCSYLKLYKKMQSIKASVHSKENNSPMHKNGSFAASHRKLGTHDRPREILGASLNINQMNKTVLNSNAASSVSKQFSPLTSISLNTRNNMHMKNNRNGTRIEEINKCTKKKYCEMCRCSYQDLDQHLLIPKHQKFLNDSDNYLILENLNTLFPNMEEFSKKTQYQFGDQSSSFRLPLADENVFPNHSAVHNSCQYVKENACFSPKVDDIAVKEENCTRIFQNSLNSASEPPVLSFNTVSASCSTLSSSNALAYLEDSSNISEPDQEPHSAVSEELNIKKNTFLNIISVQPIFSLRISNSSNISEPNNELHSGSDELNEKENISLNTMSIELHTSFSPKVDEKPAVALNKSAKLLKSTETNALEQNNVSMTLSDYSNMKGNDINSLKKSGAADCLPSPQMSYVPNQNEAFYQTPATDERSQELVSKYHEHGENAELLQCTESMGEFLKHTYPSSLESNSLDRNICEINEQYLSYFTDQLKYLENASLENEIDAFNSVPGHSEVNPDNSYININGCTIKKFPFTNFGFGPGLQTDNIDLQGICNETYVEVTQHPSSVMNDMSPTKTKVDMDFEADSSCDSNCVADRKILNDNVLNLCKSLEIQEKNSNTNLSMNKSPENSVCSSSEGQGALDLSFNKVIVAI